ncbi:tripeptidyl-peptidase I [Fusarium heterosporum]|uniref:tripeptidyl-peptidase II n=1 Tax=Fusarium heterosporum TaxID=42747 RepID=A0A8H5WKR4_FUSHE|nr:tripeptidyl-peptidase I [Fusarium heterosporum]
MSGLVLFFKARLQTGNKNSHNINMLVEIEVGVFHYILARYRDIVSQNEYKDDQYPVIYNDISKPSTTHNSLFETSTSIAMLATIYLKVWGILLSATSVLAIPVVVESLSDTPADWEELDSLDPDKLVDFSIGLEPKDSQLLDRTIYEVSDPDRATYGQYLSRESAKALLSPSLEATRSVKRWLSDAGVPEHYVRDEGEWLHVRTTISKAEGMLNTRFSVYARDNEHIVRTKEYSVPLEIRHHITSIQPTTFFPTLRKAPGTQQPEFKITKRDSAYDKKPSSPKDGNNGGPGPINLQKCKDELTPACIKEIYKMPKNYPKTAKGALYTIVGFKNLILFFQMTSQKDELQEFFRRFTPQLEGVVFSDASAAGGSNPQGDNVPESEGNMNTQQAISLAHGVPVQFLSVGGFNFDFVPDLDLQKVPGDYQRSIENWLALAEHILNLPDSKLPQVVSMSYAEWEQHIPKQYARQVCNKFGQIGTRGVSILVAAANDGVGAGCQSNDGKKTTKFNPAWPAVCPYVTAVGGTMGNSPERVWNEPEILQAGGGGFSDSFVRPQYQEKIVKDYLTKYGEKWKPYFNQNGRAYPDVSAFAAGQPVMRRGEQVPSGGTSAATPAVGSVIALLNNERLKRGKPAMGFLNPWLYSKGHAGFTDIVDGKSGGCYGESREGLPSPKIPNAGWDAVKGWDPASGWGTPRSFQGGYNTGHNCAKEEMK